MKKFTALFLSLLMSVGTSAQTANTVEKFNVAWGVEYRANLVKNPSAIDNLKYITPAGTVTRDTSTDGKTLNGLASIKITGSSGLYDGASHSLHPALGAMLNPLNLCKASIMYKGTGTKYKMAIEDTSTVHHDTLLQDVTDWTIQKITLPCSTDVNRKVYIYKSETGTADLQYGEVTYTSADGDFGTLSKDTFTAKVSSTGVVSDETGGDWINGICSITSSVTTCTFTAGFFTQDVNCSVTPFIASSNRALTVTVSSSTQLLFTGYQLLAAGVADTGAILSCTKTGADSSSFAITSVSSPSAPKIVKYTSGSGTYTPTAGTKYIKVRMVGAGGGGGGSGSSGNTAGGNGSAATTFGSDLVANVGLGGAISAAAGGVGGSASCGAITTCTGIGGSQGSAGGYTVDAVGGAGGSSYFDGGVGSTARGDAGAVPAGNSGSGGSGGGGSASVAGGSGGGSGAYIEASILNPAAMSYVIGTGGGGGNAGTSGFAGGAGAAGYIEITEYFSTSDVISFGDIPVMSYSANSSNAVGATPTLIKFNVPNKDNFNMYDSATGLATIKQDGDYELTVGVLTNGGLTVGTTAIFELSVWKNGSLWKHIDRPPGNGSTVNYPAGGTIVIPGLVVNDTLSIYMSSSAGATTLIGAAAYNNLSIRKISR